MVGSKWHCLVLWIVLRMWWHYWFLQLVSYWGFWLLISFIHCLMMQSWICCQVVAERGILRWLLFLQFYFLLGKLLVWLVKEMKTNWYGQMILVILKYNCQLLGVLDLGMLWVHWPDCIGCYYGKVNKFRGESGLRIEWLRVKEISIFFVVLYSCVL